MRMPPASSLEKRRRIRFFVVCSFLVFSSTICQVDGLASSLRKSITSSVVRRSTRLWKSAQNRSWSGSSEQKSGSRTGVRTRVKEVLKKARRRTGIQNFSSEEEENPSVVAEAASIGGLGDGDFAMQISRRNGKSNDKVRDGGIDAIKGDVPAAFADEPLPFTLPQLSDEQRRQLKQGVRIQEQSKMGRDGSGFVVLDVKAPPYVIWECLLDFESYTETIPTVRGVEFFSSEHLKDGYRAEKPVLPGIGRETRHYGIPSVTRVAFILSKFRLNIAAIHNYRPHPAGDYMIFTLDPACTNFVLKNAKGIWYTESNPDGRGEDYTRVWLLCSLSVSRALPTFIVDYAAKRAMPRATTWLRPQVEAAAELWLKRPNGSH